MDDLRGFICECKDGNTGRLCEKMLIGNSGKRIRKRFVQFITNREVAYTGGSRLIRISLLRFLKKFHKFALYGFWAILFH